MKKKVIKPFDIEEYKDDRYEVETKCGYHVKFLKTDTLCICDADNHKRTTGYPVMARMDTPMGDRFAFYTIEGKFYDDSETNMDLVLVEEQEIPSVTKEEVKEHLQWFVDNADCLIESLGAKVHEKLLSMVIAMRTAYRIKDDDIVIDQDEEKHENVKYCVLKLEGLENMPAEGVAMAYVRDAVGSANKVLGYSAKERNAFSWQKVWRNQGCFGVIDEKNAKKIVEKCPDFQFRLYYKSNITSDDHGEA